MFHENPQHLVQIVENALEKAHKIDIMLWDRIYTFYELRYLNHNSPEKEAFRNYGHPRY